MSEADRSTPTLETPKGFHFPDLHPMADKVREAWGTFRYNYAYPEQVTLVFELGMAGAAGTTALAMGFLGIWGISNHELYLTIEGTFGALAAGGTSVLSGILATETWQKRT